MRTERRWEKKKEAVGVKECFEIEIEIEIEIVCRREREDEKKERRSEYSKEIVVVIQSVSLGSRTYEYVE